MTTEKGAAALLGEGLLGLDREVDELRKLRLFTLSELAEALTEEAKASLREEGILSLSPFPPSGNAAEGCPAEYLPLLRAQGEDTRAADLVALSVFLAERLAGEIDPVAAWRASRPKGSRICYVPSTHAEAAYAVCVAEKESVSLLLADNAELGCAALTSGNADYLLLPYAGKSGTRLVSTERLIERYDLYTVALLRLREEEGEVTYGLFSLYSAPFAEREEMLLSLRVTVASYADLGRMLTAFSALGFAVEELATVTEDYGRVTCKVILREMGNDTALWLYLCLYAGSFSFLGRFPSLAAEGYENRKESKQ